MDDIVIFSDTWTEHLLHLQTVLNLIRDRGLTIKESKCQIGMAWCQFLGHMVGNGRIQPLAAKIRDVRDFIRPKKKKQVRAFLGLAGYYRRFIDKYSIITSPLSDLTKDVHPDKVQWTITTEAAFQEVKNLLASAPILRCPRWKETFYLQTDASGKGIAGVLSQRHAEEEHPIAYFSKIFSPAERNYSAVEQECLAVVKSVKHFSVYLSNQPFVIETDNKALVHLNRFRDANSRMVRWALSLQPYDFEVTHRAGTANGNADSLSRQFSDETTTPTNNQGGESVRKSPLSNSPNQISELMQAAACIKNIATTEITTLNK